MRARGFWRAGQNAFFDVRITNADCSSQVTSPVKSVLRKHELEKKRNYNQRIIQVEHGTLTPLIFTTSGAMGHECQKFHKTLAEKISVKNGDKYEDIMRYIRLKFSFLVLKATLLCLRGSRTIRKNSEVGNDFSLCLHELRLWSIQGEKLLVEKQQWSGTYCKCFWLTSHFCCNKLLCIRVIVFWIPIYRE